MLNRSMPPGVVIPELPYADVREAVEWLCRSFGCVERLRIGNHRAQLLLGEGSVIVIQRGADATGSFSLLVRVRDIDEHYQRVKSTGTRIVNPPADYPYGERQYTAEDLGGHRWTFSQTIANIDPSTWGGNLLE